tara:strand:+ start:1239 stop:1535 length:297 start_codon:yes stop_codon:yes gene_type:complete
MNNSKDIMKQLAEVISVKRYQSTDTSYTARLFKKGRIKIANKLGEEATETISAFLSQGSDEIKDEAADMIYHLLVLLEYSEISWEEILKTLEKRMKND